LVILRQNGFGEHVFGRIMSKVLTILVMALVLNAHADEAPLYVDMTDNLPETGVTAEVFLGDRMLLQRTGQYKECLVPKFSFTKKFLSSEFEIKANEVLFKASESSKYFTSTYPNSIQGGTPYFYELEYKTKRGKIQLCFKSGVGCIKKELTENDFDYSACFINQINSIQQTIEYSGKEGSNLKFLYSEFSPDVWGLEEVMVYEVIRSGVGKAVLRNSNMEPIHREFQMDLGEGNVIAYKGAIIEVETATNMAITYKVIRNFQEN